MDGSVDTRAPYRKLAFHRTTFRVDDRVIYISVHRNVRCRASRALGYINTTPAAVSKFLGNITRVA